MASQRSTYYFAVSLLSFTVWGAAVRQHVGAKLMIVQNVLRADDLYLNAYASGLFSEGRAKI